MSDPVLGKVELPPKGCICPPTSERTCQRWDCGRKPLAENYLGGQKNRLLADACDIDRLRATHQQPTPVKVVGEG